MATRCGDISGTRRTPRRVPSSERRVHRTTRLPRWASFLIAGTTIKVIPHVRGVMAHRYPFNGRDWAFDAFIGAAPLDRMDRMDGRQLAIARARRDDSHDRLLRACVLRVTLKRAQIAAAAARMTNGPGRT